MENNHILVVDDDRNILKILELYLKKEGFEVTTCEKGTNAYETFKSVKPAIVLLDVMMPGKDGFAVLKEIRENAATPVIMLTAMGSTTDRVRGLELGADDYVAKPFDAKELTARVKAVLRRTVTKDEEEKITEFRLDGLYISIENYEVLVDDKKVEMAPKEIELLFFLATHDKKVFTREQLLEQVWGFEFYGDTRTVDVHVKRVRDKIGEKYAAMICTVWAVGYKFSAADYQSE